MIVTGQVEKNYNFFVKFYEKIKKYMNIQNFAENSAQLFVHKCLI